MGQCQVRAALIMLLVAATAGCGAGSSTAVPSEVARASPTAFPDLTPSAEPAATVTTPVPGRHATPTITVEPGVEADGPGANVRGALANASIGLQLVNGILLRAVDGTVWLCDVLLTSSPPQCSEPRLLVENRAQEDQTFVDHEGLHEADGVRWVEHMQLFGTVRP